MTDEHPTAKVMKLEETSSKKVNANAGSGLPDSNLEKRLKEQSDLLWGIKDELKKNVSMAEMREMLEANDQDSSGSEYDLRDRW
jgi:poly [ADP-ribose] polymerase 1